MNDKILEIKSLSFAYKKSRTIVLKDINLSIPKGEIFGVLGTNGSGKTTLIRILSTLVKNYKGKVVIDGLDLKKEPAKIRESFVSIFQDVIILGENITGYQSLMFYAKLYSVQNAQGKITELAELMGLEGDLDKKVKHYSGGMKRRLDILRCFMVSPKILFLDEPTRGLDPFIKHRIWEHIKEINKKNRTTIVVTTHDTEEAEYLCNRIAILIDGRLMAVDSPVRLKLKSKNRQVRIKLKSGADNLIRALREQKWAQPLSCSKSEIRFVLNSPRNNFLSMLNLIVEHNFEVLSFDYQGMSLSDAFIEYVKRDKKR